MAGTRALRSNATAVAILLLSIGCARAQSSMPSGSTDLLLPPEWRSPSVPGPATLPRAKPQTHVKHAAGHVTPDGPGDVQAGAAPPRPKTSSTANAGAEHPEEFGLAVHGGGNVPQHYTVSSGSSAPGEEDGDGVAASFKFGF